MKLLLFLVFALPGWATWTMVQHTGFNTFSEFGSGSCGPAVITACTVNVTSTGASHLLVCFAMTAGQALSACTGESGAWVHCANCSQTVNSLVIDAWYILSTTGGSTSISCNQTAGTNAFFACFVREYSTTSGPVVFDTSGNGAPTSCTSCAGVTLSLTGTNDVIVQTENPSNTCSAISAPYGNADIGSTTGIGAADRLNTNSGTAPTWTCSSTNLGVSGLAFKETAVSVPTGIAAMNKPTNTPIFQPIGIVTYFRRRRDYIRAWIQRRLRKPCLLDLMHPDGSPVFEETPKELVEIYKREHGGILHR